MGFLELSLRNSYSPGRGARIISITLVYCSINCNAVYLASGCGENNLREDLIYLLFSTNPNTISNALYATRFHFTVSTIRDNNVSEIQTHLKFRQNHLYIFRANNEKRVSIYFENILYRIMSRKWPERRALEIFPRQTSVFPSNSR